jgi:hypothetical protein
MLACPGPVLEPTQYNLSREGFLAAVHDQRSLGSLAFFRSSTRRPLFWYAGPSASCTPLP